MRRLLLPLLAAFALPTAANAETHWLILHYRDKPGLSSMQKVEMPNPEECEKEGRKWEDSSTHGDASQRRRFHCVIGK